MRAFKGVLCLEMRPQARDYGRSLSHPYRHMCKRHLRHEGAHRVVYQDAIIEWGEGIIDRERKTERQP